MRQAVLVRVQQDLHEEATLKNPKPFASSTVTCCCSARVLLVCLTSMGGVEFSCVMPSLWSYVQQITADTQNSGGGPWSPVDIQLYSQFAFTFATMFGKLICGWLADRLPFSWLFATVTILGACGGLTYGLSRDFGGVPMLLAARVLGGTANAVTTLASAYVVRSTPNVQERSQKLATNAAATLIGIFVGPSIVPLFARVHARIGWLTLDENNLPGFFIFLAFSILGVLQPLLLVEPEQAIDSGAAQGAGSRADDSPDYKKGGDAGGDGEACTAGAAGITQSLPLMRLSLVLDFAMVSTFALTFFSTTPVIAIVTDVEFSWDAVPNAYLFLAIAGFTLGGVLLTGRLLKGGVAPTPIIFVSALLLLLHELVVALAEGLVFASPTQFLFWLGLAAISYASLNGSINASVTGATTTENAGLVLGLLGFADSASQALAPLMLKHVGANEQGARMAHVLAVSRGILALPTAVLLSGYAFLEAQRILHLHHLAAHSTVVQL